MADCGITGGNAHAKKFRLRFSTHYFRFSIKGAEMADIALRRLEVLAAHIVPSDFHEEVGSWRLYRVVDFDFFLVLLHLICPFTVKVGAFECCNPSTTWPFVHVAVMILSLFHRV